MKQAIAIFSVVIVGSNASLLSNVLNPVTNVLDAASALTQARALLSSLQSQLAQGIDDVSTLVNRDLQQVNNAIQDFKSEIFGTALEVLGGC